MKMILRRSYILAVLTWFAVAHSTSAQPLRFYATPYQVYEGSAVTFIYLDNINGVPVPGVIQRTNILHWSWDFNSDGVVDDSSDSGSTSISATWYAVYDPTKAVSGVDTFTPTLTVTYTNPITGGIFTTNQKGITESMYGNGTVSSNFFVLQYGVGNQDIQLSVSANPRLATNGQTIRFYLSTTMLNAGSVNSAQIVWNFGDGTPPTNGTSSPTHQYATNGLYAVSVQVGYSVTGPPYYTNMASETLADFVNVISVPSELQLGRA